MLINSHFWQSFILRSFLFEGAGDGGAGGGTGGGQGGDPDPGSGGGHGDPNKNPGETGVWITTAKLSGRINSAVTKAVRDASANIFTAAGVSSAEELQELVGKAREGESAAQTYSRKEAQWQAERSQLVGELESLRREKKQSTITTAITTAIDAEASAGRKVVKASQVIGLLRRDLDVDDGGNVIVLQDGQPAHGLSVEKHLKKFLDDNTNLLQDPTPTGGVGGRPKPGSGSGNNKPPDYRSLDSVGRAQALKEELAKVTS